MSAARLGSELSFARELSARFWRRIVAAGPRAPLSPTTTALQAEIAGALDGTVDRTEWHEFELLDWEGERGEATVGEETFECCPAIQSPGAVGLTGTLALPGIQAAWGMRRWRRYALVDDAGEPLAVVLVRPNGEAIAEPVLPGSLPIPHVVLGTEAAHALALAYRHGEEVELQVPARLGGRTRARSLLAHLDGDPELPRVLICAHLDSVYTSAGSYDNASGAAVLVGLAHLLASAEPRPPASFAWFNAEEWSMAGSAAFAHERAGEYDLVVNLDGFGRGGMLELWAGPEWFELWVHRLFAEAGRGLGWLDPADHLTAIAPPPSGSDHDAFHRAGLPVLMLTHDDQQIIHSPADDDCLPEIWTHMEQGLTLLERVLPELLASFAEVRAAYEGSAGPGLGIGWTADAGEPVSNLTALRAGGGAR